MVQPGGHIVLQYEADNPGVWPFHCHIAWHLSLVSWYFFRGRYLWSTFLKKKGERKKEKEEKEMKNKKEKKEEEGKKDSRQGKS